MTESPSIIMISVWIGLFVLCVDLYVVAHWSSTAKSMRLSLLWSRIPWGLLVVMNLVYWYVVYRRNFYRLDGIDVALFAMVTLWSLPKVGIVPFLIVRDVYRLVDWLRRRSTARRRAQSGPSLEADSIQSAEQGMHDHGRRRALSHMVWGMSIIPYGLAANGMFRTLYDFRVHSVEIVLPNLPRALDGIRIVQISDIHAGSFYDHTPVQEARRIIEGLRPDLIVITGDFVNAKPMELSVIWSELVQLRAPEGVLGVLGNHDHYHNESDHIVLISEIRRSGIDLLVNQHRTIRHGSERLIIAGTDNTGFRQNFARLDDALGGASRDDAVILLAHDPTFFDRGVRNSAVGLMLSGHTHGGQVGANVLGVEWSPAQYVYKHWAGLYKEERQFIYVNRGLGTVGPPMRIGIQPEITHITLRSPSISSQGRG